MGHTGRRNLVIHVIMIMMMMMAIVKIQCLQASLKWTPLVFEKGVGNWNWLLMGMQNYRVCMRVEKNKQTNNRLL